MRLNRHNTFKHISNEIILILFKKLTHFFRISVITYTRDFKIWLYIVKFRFIHFLYYLLIKMTKLKVLFLKSFEKVKSL